MSCIQAKGNALRPSRGTQNGAVFMIMLLILILGSAAFLVSSLNSIMPQLERDRKTTDALAQAKDALIGFAASVDLTSSARPGDLPCPDNHLPGTASEGTSSSSCNTQASRIGRLPWKTLGLPDLRDGSGERLWYAVSNNFKNSTRTTCTNSNLTGCLNSDTPGTISIFSPDGTLTNNPATGNGVAAVIIAPGDVLQRQDGIQQDRSSSGASDPRNYLDTATIGGNTEDNASFVDNSSTNGFIQGRIKDSNNSLIVNDQLLAIKAEDLMPTLQKRVAAEVRNCLTEYAALPQNQGPAPNQGYYPWAASRTPGPPVVYNDSDRLEFGHVPDMFFSATCSDTGGINCNGLQVGGMRNSWGPTCTLTNSNWWVNWKELVFYGFAHSLRPHNLTHNHACVINTSCLTVNPPSAAADKPFVVIVAGKKIGTQVRATNADKSTLINYLEGQNSDGATPFEQSPPSSSFNDWLVYP